MKKNSLLSLALLAVLITSAQAAHPQLRTEPIVLPTYVVEAPRLQRAEQRVHTSLNELRALASRPTAIPVDLSTLKAQVNYAANDLRRGSLAKS